MSRCAAAPLDMALYMSFFPQLVAGPIVRAAYFLPQLARPADEPIPVAAALLLILGGLFKKVIIANYLATGLVDPVFAAPTSYGGPDLLLATYGYAVQIYCDFSAYTDIAIALAALLRLPLSAQFQPALPGAAPARILAALAHLAVSTWLRDYLYKPLGGNRHGRLKTYRNLMITMLLGGIWHGAAWKFVMWGALHGGGLAVERMCRAVARPAADEPRRRRSSATLIVFHFVCFAWIFFRAEDFAVARRLHRRARQRLERAGAAGAAGDGGADRDRHGRAVPAAGLVRAGRRWRSPGCRIGVSARRPGSSSPRSTRSAPRASRRSSISGSEPMVAIERAASAPPLVTDAIPPALRRRGISQRQVFAICLDRRAGAGAVRLARHARLGRAARRLVARPPAAQHRRRVGRARWRRSASPSRTRGCATRCAAPSTGSGARTARYTARQHSQGDRPCSRP